MFVIYARQLFNSIEPIFVRCFILRHSFRQAGRPVLGLALLCFLCISTYKHTIYSVCVTCNVCIYIGKSRCNASFQHYSCSYSSHKWNQIRNTVCYLHADEQLLIDLEIIQYIDFIFCTFTSSFHASQ